MRPRVGLDGRRTLHGARASLEFAPPFLMARVKNDTKA